MEDELDERKLKILDAIIQTYFETGEPVGSRTISKYTDLSLSSATIRNEMSDLEDMGYIVQPHTSAGRIPTDKGYRLYVNHILSEKEEELNNTKEKLISKTEKLEEVLKQVVKILANNTNYTSVVSAPAAYSNKVKFVQLSQVNAHQILSVVVMDGNLVKNRIIEVEAPLSSEDLLRMNMLLNTSLNGLSVSDINLGLIQKIKAQSGNFEDIIEQVLKTIADTITEDKDEMEVYTSGATNIFKYPELSDKESAKELISTLEDKSSLSNLIKETQEDKKGNGTGIQVYIGSESPISNMKDCSVVTATYELSEGVKGTIGIIGPKRMDYKNVVKNLTELRDEIDKILSDDS